MEVAEFLCAYRRVFAPLRKDRFFVIYYRCVTLADGLVGDDAHIVPWVDVLPHLRVAINVFVCYNTRIVGDGFPVPKSEE